VQRCPSCSQCFSGDARFCPFDGELLQVAEGYRAESDPLANEIIDGRYEVEAVLGQGGMGKVYSVLHRALGKRFALKMMRPELAAQGDLAARFIQEARATALIGHPNIVQISDFGQVPGGAPYFVMELLDGAPLSKVLRQGGPPPIEFSVRVLSQVAAGLGAAHAAGVIHRDLKPDNIHVTAAGNVKILDFGVAKVAGAGRLTRTGVVFGTPHYMSPEQASGGAVDHRADLYALGVIMYEMFTGRVPFEADTYMGVLTKHMFMRPEPLTEVYEPARQLGALEDVTFKCLEKAPEARYASAQEIIDDVNAIVRFVGERAEVVRPSRRPSARPSGLADALELPAREELDLSIAPAGVPRRIPRWALVGGSVAVVMASGGLLFALLHTSSAPSARKKEEASNVEVREVADKSELDPVGTAAPGAPSTAPSIASTSVASAERARSVANTKSAASRSDEVRTVRPPTYDAKRTRGAPPVPGGTEIVNPWKR
jgi:serine/threonine-protein kinase